MYELIVRYAFGVVLFRLLRSSLLAVGSRTYRKDIHFSIMPWMME